MEPLKQAKIIFDAAQKELAGHCDLEIYLSLGQGRSISWSEKQCEKISQSEGGGAGVRVVTSSGQQGYAFTTSLESAAVRQSAKAALESAQMMPPDPSRKIAEKAHRTVDWNEKNFIDSDLFKENIAAVKNRLMSGESELLKKYPDLKSIVRASFGEGFGEAAIVNSRGISASYASSSSSLGVSCLAARADERQEGGYGISRIFSKQIDWNFVFEESAKRALCLLGGRPVASGTVPVIFDPGIACEFFDLVANAVCADTVQKGKSLLAGKIGVTVASPLVTFIDDGILKEGLASSPFDDEGTPTQCTTLIEKGKLKAYLYDNYSAQKDGVSSTGNASRAGYKSSPSVGTSNFYLQAGKSHRAELLKQTRGIYLYEVMGLHMADPISGDFSVAAIGAWLEDGVFQHGVRGVTLAGNILELLKNIDAVCDDLTFFGSTGSPTLRVQGLSLSGAQ